MSKNDNAGKCNAVLFGMLYLMFGILLPDAIYHELSNLLFSEKLDSY